MTSTTGDTGWVGVDLDGTLAFYDRWRGERHIGAPIPAMVERVKEWLARGVRVKVFTARVSDLDGRDEIVGVIQDWCERYIGQRLEVTCIKDYGMIELWDDRVVQVVSNTGVAVGTENSRLLQRLRDAA